MNFFDILCLILRYLLVYILFEIDVFIFVFDKNEYIIS